MFIPNCERQEKVTFFFLIACPDAPIYWEGVYTSCGALAGSTMSNDLSRSYISLKMFLSHIKSITPVK